MESYNIVYKDRQTDRQIDSLYFETMRVKVKKPLGSFVHKTKISLNYTWKNYNQNLKI